MLRRSLPQCDSFPREAVHELRRNDLRAALAQDVMRRDFGYRPRVFRDTLCAVLAER